MCLKICYNLWNLLSMWLFLLINTITTAENNSSNAVSNADNSDNMFTANSNTCMNSIDDNLHDYLSFDMCLVLNYMNNQLIYYYISDAISATKQAHFQQLMKQHKIFLELIRWNSIFNNNNKSSIFKKFIIFVIKNSNSDCSAFLSNYKNIKINTSNISKLTYNSTVV